MSIDFKALAAVFPEEDIEWRIGRGGVTNGEPWANVLAYIDARAVMDRLDAVVGPGNWKDEYSHNGQNVMCGISIKIEGEWVTKYDGSEETDIESFKGGLSKALVRCGVKWGIGRYLYNLGKMYADFAEVKRNAPGSIYAKLDGKEYYWLPPKLPKWAIPEEKYKERKAKVEEIKKANVEAFNANPDNVKNVLKMQVKAIMGAKKMTLGEINTICNAQFNKNAADLEIEELQELLKALEMEQQ